MTDDTNPRYHTRQNPSHNLLRVEFSTTSNQTNERLITMKIALTSALLLSTAHAFAPSKTRQVASQALKAELNGWTPDESKFCYGLPGSLAPAGEFDPLGFAAGADLDTIKRYREAEGTSQGCGPLPLFWMRICGYCRHDQTHDCEKIRRRTFDA